MFKNITKLVGLTLVAALFINCPKEKEDDNTALLALLALSSSGATCQVTASGISLGAIPLSNAGTNGNNASVSSIKVGSATLAVISAKGVRATQKITITGGPTSSTIFKQSECPLNTSQNVATVTTDYTVGSTSISHVYTINTAGDYLIFINTTNTITAGIGAAVTDN
ncbi:hypothetical protein P3G55_06865 [Leptospira sp. 96542]|nr:hypothetical protein [Leptospira sp. 96542]